MDGQALLIPAAVLIVRVAEWIRWAAARTEWIGNRGVDMEIERELAGLADPEIAEILGRFFKTGPGEYGEGDRFLGIRVPALRRLARKYETLGLSGCRALLISPYHEAT